VWKISAAFLLCQVVLDDAQKSVAQGDESGGTAYEIAAIYAIQGNKTETLKWVQKTVEAGFLYYRYLERDSMFENIRDDVQFQQIIENVKAKISEMRRRVE